MALPGLMSSEALVKVMVDILVASWRAPGRAKVGVARAYSACVVAAFGGLFAGAAGQKVQGARALLARYVEVVSDDGVRSISRT